MSWIKSPPDDFVGCKSFMDNTIFLWESENKKVYVMDNHLSSAWCWINRCNPKDMYDFMHIDRHSDLALKCFYDFLETEQFLNFKKNPKIDFSSFTDISKVKDGVCRKLFQWDNYIRVIHYLYPHWFNRNIFYFYEGESNCPKTNYCDEFVFVRETPDAVIKGVDKYLRSQDSRFPNRKWILNLDLDFFWKDNGVRRFDDTFIYDLSKRINAAMSNIEVFTIAISPDCIGWKWDEARHVLDIMKTEVKELEEFII